jgi:hypothetical protein
MHQADRHRPPIVVVKANKKPRAMCLMHGCNAGGSYPGQLQRTPRVRNARSPSGTSEPVPHRGNGPETHNCFLQTLLPIGCMFPKLRLISCVAGSGVTRQVCAINRHWKERAAFIIGSPVAQRLFGPSNDVWSGLPAQRCDLIDLFKFPAH